MAADETRLGAPGDPFLEPFRDPDNFRVCQVAAYSLAGGRHESTPTVLRGTPLTAPAEVLPLLP